MKRSTCYWWKPSSCVWNQGLFLQGTFTDLRGSIFSTLMLDEEEQVT